MSAAAVRSALESNRRFTDLKDAQARLSQAQRDLVANTIDNQEYQRISDICIKIIRATRWD